MRLAFEYCKGEGIEFGAAAHNPFELPYCRNVAPCDGVNAVYEQDMRDFAMYSKEQGDMCQQIAPVDLVGDMMHIPVEDNSLDYVISSHVIEHEPNPIQAFQNISRKIKDGGIVFMIFPKRNALYGDAIRPLTTLNAFIENYQSNKTPLTAGMEHRTHYCVYSLQSMLNLVNWCNREKQLGWVLEALEETDSKVGNGHTLVFRRDAAFAAALAAGWRAEDEYATVMQELSRNTELTAERVHRIMQSLKRTLSMRYEQPVAWFFMAQFLSVSGARYQSQECMRQALLLDTENADFRKYFYDTYGMPFQATVL